MPAGDSSHACNGFQYPYAREEGLHTSGEGEKSQQDSTPRTSDPLHLILVKRIMNQISILISNHRIDENYYNRFSYNTSVQTIYFQRQKKTSSIEYGN